MNKLSKHTLRPEHQQFSYEKYDIYKMGQGHHKGPSLTSFDLKAEVIRLGDGWQVSGRSTDSLDCVPSK